MVIDGKTFKYAAKRLGPVRGRAGRGLGGKALVAMELGTGLLVGLAVDPDGHANEAKLVPRLLPAVRGRLPGANLWVADRQFGDLARVRRVRRVGRPLRPAVAPEIDVRPRPAETRPRGTDRDGRAWTDAAGELRSQRQGAAAVRLVTLTRPGKEPLRIVTDLIDADRYPANDLLELYRRRGASRRSFRKSPRSST